MYFNKLILKTAIIVVLLITITNVKSVIAVENYTQTICIPTPEERLKSLEPQKPVNLDDPWWSEEIFPAEIYSFSEIKEKGKELPLYFIFNNGNWKRPSYKEYWHSTVSGGRWSYVPTRIHYSLHRLFTTYETASIFYDFTHNLGIIEETGAFDYSKIPNYKNREPFDYVAIVVMQGKVEKIITYRNQVILISKPRRTGLQVLLVPTNMIEPAEKDKNILYQLVTEQGDEIDFSLLPIVN